MRFNKKVIKRTGDLIPKGVKSTYGERGDYNQTWEHIYKGLKEIK
jgi:hypothetical protein